MVTIRREEAESSLHKGGERIVPRQRTTPGNCCVTWAQGSQLLPHCGRQATPEGPRGAQAPKGRPTKTWKLPALQGGKDGCSSTFQVTSLLLTPA